MRTPELNGVKDSVFGVKARSMGCMDTDHNERVVGSRVQGSPDPSVADTPVLPQMMSRGNSELRKAAGNLIPKTVHGVQDTLSIIYTHTLSYGTEKWISCSKGSNIWREGDGGLT